MTLRHMEIFVAVCEENGVTRAAERLHLAQPAVSLAIREMEEHYDVHLFDRISKRLYLTDAGRNLLEYATHIVSLFADMENDVRRWERTGNLKIGSSITIGTRLMPKYVSAFRDLHPQARVEVTVSSSEVIEKKLLRSELDFALIEGSVHSDGIVCETYLRDRLAVVCSSLSPLCAQGTITVEQLLAQPLLLREPGSGTRELFDNIMAPFEHPYAPSWESTSTQALVGAVAMGLGISVLPYPLVADSIKEGVVFELLVEGIRFDRGFHIVYHKNKFLTALAKEFIDLCRDYHAR